MRPTKAKRQKSCTNFEEEPWTLWTLWQTVWVTEASSVDHPHETGKSEVAPSRTRPASGPFLQEREGTLPRDGNHAESQLRDSMTRKLLCWPLTHSPCFQLEQRF